MYTYYDSSILVIQTCLKFVTGPVVVVPQIAKGVSYFWEVGSIAKVLAVVYFQVRIPQRLKV